MRRSSAAGVPKPQAEHAGERFTLVRDEERALLAGVVVRKPVDLFFERSRDVAFECFTQFRRAPARGSPL